MYAIHTSICLITYIYDEIPQNQFGDCGELEIGVITIATKVNIQR